jgi:hypothetical protein
VNSAEATLSASGVQAPSAMTAGPTGSYRGVAFLVGALVIGAGLLYMLGMLIVEDPRWRKAAVRTVMVTAPALRGAWTRVLHPIHRRSVQMKIGLPN